MTLAEITKVNESGHFCTTCGQPLLLRRIPGYDYETGEPLIEEYCPTQLCSHVGKSHNWAWKKKGYFTHVLECTFCGVPIDYEGRE